jgi:hypothetical protein
MTTSAAVATDTEDNQTYQADAHENSRSMKNSRELHLINPWCSELNVTLVAHLIGFMAKPTMEIRENHQQNDDCMKSSRHQRPVRE